MIRWNFRSNLKYLSETLQLEYARYLQYVEVAVLNGADARPASNTALSARRWLNAPNELFNAGARDDR